MRQTINNMLGTLPPQFFDVTVRTYGENMAQLMQSMLMTGYLFRNALYRLELQASFDYNARPEKRFGDEDAEEDGKDSEDEGRRSTSFAFSSSPERDPADVDTIRAPATSSSSSSLTSTSSSSMTPPPPPPPMLIAPLPPQPGKNNRIIEHLRGMNPNTLQGMTEHASGEVLEAMNRFITRLTGTDDVELRKTTPAQATAVELAQLLYWSCIVGYELRCLEVRAEMDKL